MRVPNASAGIICATGVPEIHSLIHNNPDGTLSAMWRCTNKTKIPTTRTREASQMKFKTAASIAALAFAGALSLPAAVQAEFPTERSPGALGDQKAPPAQGYAGAGYPQKATPPEGQNHGAQPDQKAQGQGSWSDLAQQQLIVR
jgi:hypothetical protein